MIDATKWFVDTEGKVRFLSEFHPHDLNVIDHGEWVEVELLAPSDAEPGRLVIDGFVLHSGNPEVEMAKWQ